MMKQPLIKSWSLLNKQFAVLIGIVLQFPYCFFAQNLVPNQSFEDILSCPFGDGEFYLAAPWYTPTTGTPDLFNSCDSIGIDGVPNNLCGNEFAKSGNGYSGIYTFSPPAPDVREYIQIALSDTLTKDKFYYVEFFVSLADLSKYSANDIGAYLSVSAVGSSVYYVLPYVPQISNSNNPLISDSGWYKISGSFVASGGEKYITIGNFKNDASTDTLTVNPGSTWDAAYYYIDDVLVMEDTSNSIDELFGSSGFTIFPNPAKDKIIFTDKFTGSSMSITNLFGQKVYSGKFKKELDISFLSEGVYIIDVALPGKTCRAKFIKVR